MELESYLSDGEFAVPYVKFPLLNYGHAVVDEADIDLLLQYRWRCQVRKTATKRYMYAEAYISSEKRSVQMHRVLMDAPSGMLVDHINGDTLDNRRSNLRICTLTENLRNCAVRCHSKSGVKGVRWLPKRKHYIARINIDGKQQTIGSFKTLEAAANAYREAALRLHGEFANFGDYTK